MITNELAFATGLLIGLFIGIYVGWFNAKREFKVKELNKQEVNKK